MVKCVFLFLHGAILYELYTVYVYNVYRIPVFFLISTVYTVYVYCIQTAYIIYSCEKIKHTHTLHY